MKRNTTIDILKSIAIMFVIITHYNWSNNQRLELLFPFWINMAVPIFMIISGYTYTKSYQKRKINTFEETYNFKNIFDKIIKYSIPFIIIYIIEIIWIYNHNHNLNISWIIKNFLTGGFGQGSYYYPLLLQLIFIFPIIYILIQNKGKKGLIICFTINLVYEVLVWAYSIPLESYRLLIFRYFFLIASGSFLASKNYNSNIKINIISLIIGFIFILIYNYLGYNPLILNYWTSTSLIASLYIIPIINLIITKIDIHFKPLEIIGKASYHIFLFQMLFYYTYATKIYNYINDRLIQLIIVFSICIIGGLIFYYFDKFLHKFILYKKSSINKNIEN